MSYRLGSVVLAVALFAFAQAAHAQKTITVNFDSTDPFETGGGSKGKATKSSMTKEQRDKAIAVAQKEYDDALGAGKVVIKEGTGGDVQMTVTGGKAPRKGSMYGEAGKSGKTGLVFQGEFGGFTGDELVNGVGETLAHEAAHKLGVAEHNRDKPPSKMTRGDLVTVDQRKQGGRSFSDHDKKKLEKNLQLTDTEPKEDAKTGDLGVHLGKTLGPLENKLEDDYLNAFVDFDAPVGTSFGFISGDGEFVWEGDWEDNPYPGFLTFLANAGANLAVSLGGQLYTLENGGGSFILSDINPFNPNVYRRADLTFNTAGGTARLGLDTTVLDSTGGFFKVPEPSTWALTIAGFLGLGGVLRIRRRPAV